MEDSTLISQRSPVKSSLHVDVVVDVDVDVVVVVVGVVTEVVLAVVVAWLFKIHLLLCHAQMPLQYRDKSVPEMCTGAHSPHVGATWFPHDTLATSHSSSSSFVLA